MGDVLLDVALAHPIMLLPILMIGGPLALVAVAIWQERAAAPVIRHERAGATYAPEETPVRVQARAGEHSGPAS